MQNEHSLAAFKTFCAWVLVALSHFAAALGNITAAQVGAYLAIAYTAVQLYVTVRDKIIRRGKDNDRV